jgi:type IV secretory pathway VirB2 component (pilin)
VDIKAANYTSVANENATVIIRFSNETLVSRKVQALNGTVTFDTWQVPVNSSEGSYMVTVRAIGSANKTVPDTQNFTVPGLLVNIKTINLNGADVAKVSTAVYENETLVASSSTNSSGWAANTLTKGGNYTLKAFWENAQVNTTRVTLYRDFNQTLICQIADVQFTVEDSTSKHTPLPLVLLNVTATYLTSQNVSQTVIEGNLTDSAGEGMFSNQLVMSGAHAANYTVRAYRAPYQTQLLFFKQNFTITQGQYRNITIFCPLFTLTVHAEDAKNALLAGYPVQIYQFLGGLYNYSTTDASGNVTLSATFGDYQVRLYNPNETILLNETYYNLVNASAFLLMRSSICHANLSVTVLDYLGLPMPNVEVELERDGAATVTLKTNGKGVAFFDSITGGSCFISISIGSGSPIETANVLVKGNTATTVTVGGYVSVFGLLVGTGQFAVILTFIVFIVLLLFFLLYRRRSKVSEEKETGKES